MYWLIDVALVLLVLIAVYRGIKKGFFGTSYGVIGTIITIALSVALGALLVVACYKFGAIDQLTIWFVGLIGETNAIFESLGLTSQTIGYYASIGLLGIIFIVLSYVLLSLINRAFINHMEDCRENVVFMVIDSTIGLAVNIALLGAFVLGTFALIHTFGQSGLFAPAAEAIEACPISNLIFQNNPLNQVFANLFNK